VAWGDYDNDGDLDILLSGYTGGNVITRVYQNNAVTANTPPPAPTGLASTVNNGTSVTLSWTAPTDTETPADGLSYNLRVGTTPGGSDIVGPMAFQDPPGPQPDGLRKIAQRGLVQGTSFTLEGLTPGQTYYWSVQAIDTTLAGGPFAGEENFLMGTTSVLIVGPDLEITDIAGGDSDDNLTVAFDSTSGEIVVSDPDNLLVGSATAGHEIRILQSDLGPGGKILVDTLGGDDLLTVDYATFATTPIVYHGGETASDNDRLVVTGNTFGRVEHTFTTSGPPNSGTILYDQDGSGGTTSDQSLITYTGLEPVDMTGSTITDLIFNLPGADDQAILEDDGTPSNGISRIRSQNPTPTFETTKFADPQGSLTVNMGGDNGQLTVAPLPDFNKSLVINGAGGDDEVRLHFSPNGILSPAAGSGLRINGGAGFNTVEIDASLDTARRDVEYFYDESDTSGRHTLVSGLGTPAPADFDDIDVYRNRAGSGMGDRLGVTGVNAPAPAGNDVIVVGGIGSGARFQVDAFECLHLAGQDGDDQITNDTNLPSLIDGGPGDDLLIGGGGTDVIFGGAGRDMLYGRGGDDFLFADLDAAGNLLPANNELVDGGPGTNAGLAISVDGEPDHRDTVLNLDPNRLLQEVEQLVFIQWGSLEDRFVFPSAEDIEALRQQALAALDALGCNDAPFGVPPEDLGAVESVSRNDLNLEANGRYWFSFTATYSGALTAEANYSAGGVQLYLFDAANNEIGSSLSGGGQERIDVQATAGAAYHLLVVGDSPDVDLSLVNMVTHHSPLTVHGTSGDDVFEFYGGDGLHFSVNGVRYDYTLAQSASVTFLGGGGNDSIRVVRSNDAEDIAVTPTWVALTHPDYVMQAVDVETIEVVGAFRQAPLQNSSNSADVNNDGVVNFADVLDTIAALRNTAAGEATSGDATMFYDVNGDTQLNFGDILAIVSVLRGGTAGGEGEASSLETSSTVAGETSLTTSDQTVYTADTTAAASTDTTTATSFTVSATSDMSLTSRIETESESQLVSSSVTRVDLSADSSILIGSSPQRSTQQDDADQTTLEEGNLLAADNYFLRLGQYDRLSSEEPDREDDTLVSDLDLLEGSSPDAEEFAALLDDVAREWF
jgi:hypothetical protein